MMSDAYEGVTWNDALTLGVSGLGWLDEARAQPFDRFPAGMKELIEDRLWELSTFPAGVYVDFVGSPERLFARWTLDGPVADGEAAHRLPHSGLDLYGRDEDGRWRWAGSRSPWNAPQCDGSLTLGPLDGKERAYRLYLPLMNRVTKLEIGAKVPLRAAEQTGDEKPIAYYGTSIVHGATVGRSGMPHACQLGRMLDREVLNLGFAGRAWLEPAVADALGRLDPAVFLIDPLPNNGPEELAERLPVFLDRLRGHRPDTPMLLIEDREFGGAAFQAERRPLQRAKNAAMHAAVEALAAGGMTGLHTAKHPAWFGEDGDGTIDGSHPSDLGAWRMATALEPHVEAVLGKA